jgi:hypothetical protein
VRRNFCKVFHHDDLGQILALMFLKDEDGPPRVEVHYQRENGKHRYCPFPFEESKNGRKACLDWFEMFDLHRAITVVTQHLLYGE